MIRHITYSDHRMTISAEKCVKSALKHGCNSSQHFMPKHLDFNFKVDYNQILNQPRGAGYWLWKPYIIHRELQRMENQEILVYTDAGVEFVNDINYLINEMKSDIMLFGNGHKHGKWCKGDVLKRMEAEDYINNDQVQASCVIIEKTNESVEFVKEWLYWCTQQGFIDDSPSKEPNEPNFIEHRHDQAILTNLAYKYSIPFNRWPAQYSLVGNEKYNNKYPQIFFHHGTRNDGTR